jgi:hypothetical protein
MYAALARRVRNAAPKMTSGEAAIRLIMVKIMLAPSAHTYLESYASSSAGDGAFAMS